MFKNLAVKDGECLKCTPDMNIDDIVTYFRRKFKVPKSKQIEGIRIITIENPIDDLKPPVSGDKFTWDKKTYTIDSISYGGRTITILGKDKKKSTIPWDFFVEEEDAGFIKMIGV